MRTDFEQQILEIFGTTDIEKLQQISEAANRNMATGENITHKGGRKNSFSEPQIAQILALQKRGEKIAHIARRYQVSRQTIYSQIRHAYHFSDNPDIRMRMDYMNHDDLCTTIDIDFKHEKIYIRNYTDQIPLRAFGVVTEPTWKDFEYFLEDRCFPRTRDHAKDILREMVLPFYAPLLIIEKTQGYMEGDHQWIMILKRKDA